MPCMQPFWVCSHFRCAGVISSHFGCAGVFSSHFGCAGVISRWNIGCFFGCAGVILGGILNEPFG